MRNIRFSSVSNMAALSLAMLQADTFDITSQVLAGMAGTTTKTGPVPGATNDPVTGGNGGGAISSSGSGTSSAQVPSGGNLAGATTAATSASAGAAGTSVTGTAGSGAIPLVQEIAADEAAIKSTTDRLTTLENTVNALVATVNGMATTANAAPTAAPDAWTARIENVEKRIFGYTF